jgi:predicted transcriptional regulator
MTRILADLPDEDIKWLDQLAHEQGKSRASVLREAVATYKAQTPAPGKKDWIERGAGYWRHRTDIGDAVEYQRAMREDRTPYDEL